MHIQQEIRVKIILFALKQIFVQQNSVSGNNQPNEQMPKNNIMMSHNCVFSTHPQRRICSKFGPSSQKCLTVVE